MYLIFAHTPNGTIWVSTHDTMESAQAEFEHAQERLEAEDAVFIIKAEAFFHKV